LEIIRGNKRLDCLQLCVKKSNICCSALWRAGEILFVFLQKKQGIKQNEKSLQIPILWMKPERELTNLLKEIGDSKIVFPIFGEFLIKNFTRDR